MVSRIGQRAESRESTLRFILVSFKMVTLSAMPFALRQKRCPMSLALCVLLIKRSF